MRTDSHDDDLLAARLDEVLPPGSADIHASPHDDLAVLAAVRIARAPHPVLSHAARTQIETAILSRADRIFTPRRRYTFRWAAAACLLVTLLAALVVTQLSDNPNPATPHAQPVPDTIPGLMIDAPSAPDTSVYIPLDAVRPAASFTEIGGGSTSIFIMPLN